MENHKNESAPENSPEQEAGFYEIRFVGPSKEKLLKKLAKEEVLHLAYGINKEKFQIYLMETAEADTVDSIHKYLEDIAGDSFDCGGTVSINKEFNVVGMYISAYLPNPSPKDKELLRVALKNYFL